MLECAVDQDPDPGSCCTKDKTNQEEPTQNEPSKQIINRKTSNNFRRKYFNASIPDWNDWKWQLRNRIRSLQQLENIINLSESERNAVRKLGGQMPVGITPYYASLFDRNNPFDPLRLTMIPVMDELTETQGEFADPLSEDSHSPVPGIVHRYPDRILFLITNFCATYCRYCTRARMVGQTGEYHFNTKQFEQGLEYIRNTPQIRDVLLSGGDPLTINDEKLEWMLKSIREISTVEFLRIGTKIPAVLPQRVTPSLAKILRKYRVWLSVHFMHPNEITKEVSVACDRLADAGIPLGSQTVLLKDVNDDAMVLKNLFHKLLMNRVRPYYLYQCDPISGSAHSRTSISKGIEIIEKLRGHTTGYAIPQFVVDAPGGGGKIPLLPEYMTGREGDYVVFKNYENKRFRYYDPLKKDIDIVNSVEQEVLVEV